MATTIVSSLIPAEVANLENHFDIRQLDLGAILSELPVARILFLDAAERKYLLLPKASPLGLFANLPQRISEAKQTGESRLTCENQLFDLELKSIRGRCQLQDLVGKNPHAIELDWQTLSTGVREGALEAWQLMKLAFPAVAQHPEADRLQSTLGIGIRKY